ncbi:uncharacterized protein LOC113353982 [Papaver somniferum]|uniref:uncharacterized protein LOC113353982 n=1 Tax=Papaver somniferum TaxID=3469 RepID=UPI000E6F5A96|nr:uncharacterized protein LOC113353982 [Papaver somniferum]
MRLVESLGLEMDWYPHPDQIDNVKNGVTICVGVCRLPFSFGKYYSDTIICEVDDIVVGDIVLGRPWLSDVGAVRRGWENSYEFRWGRTKVILTPFPRPGVIKEHLQDVVEDDLTTDGACHKNVIVTSLISSEMTSSEVQSHLCPCKDPCSNFCTPTFWGYCMTVLGKFLGSSYIVRMVANITSRLVGTCM